MGLDMYLTAHTPSEIGYWRKANAIHKWFCDNLNNGEEINCSPKEVSREQLETLRDLCVEVSKNPEKASELLPTKSGFFFGNTEYSEYYFEDIDKTIEIITKALEVYKDYVIQYDAWW